ncbi:MAG: mercuric reductase [Planctomycetota bacterium]|nr:mercuric reductase [Planctomycetota bacterium]
MAESYDAVVIGTGQAGKPLAGALARAGWRVAIVEKGAVGGTCVNVGCTPTKTMVASARVAYLARRAADYGVRTGEVDVDLGVVRRRKRDIVESFSSGGRKGLERTDGLDLISGEASFSARDRLVVRDADGTTRELAAKKVFINTGCRPARPPLEGLDDVPSLDSSSIMELDAVPDHLIVIGGGYIALEFGQMFRRFGSRVTVVQRGRQLLSREDPDVAEEVLKILRDDGIQVLLETRPLGVSTTRDGGGISLTVEGPGGEKKSVDGSHLLVATGRTPNTEALNLAAAGLETDARGYVPVNERLETAVDGIYALGDVNGGPAFTHVAYDDFRIVRDNLLEGGDRTTTDRLVPYTVFIDPQLGRVGLSEKEAREAGREVRVARLPMTHVARALEVDETRGFMKALVDPGTDEILGCAVLGVEGGEVMSVLQMAMMGRVPYPSLRDGIFAHPTLAESLNNLFTGL